MTNFINDNTSWCICWIEYEAFGDFKGNVRNNSKKYFVY